jgi:hypothetical protein
MIPLHGLAVPPRSDIAERGPETTRVLEGATADKNESSLSTRPSCGLSEQLVDGLVQPVDGGADCRGRGETALDEQRHSRTKQPIVAASQEERHLEAECGDPISLRPDDTFDEPMQSEASQIARHSTR